MKKRLIIGAIVIGFTILLLTRCVNIGMVDVSGSAMVPTIQDKDRLGVDKGYYKNHKVERGDIILYDFDGKMNVKRVVGLPGEFLQLKDGQLLTDGEPKNEKYNDDEIVDSKLEEGITLGDDEYFIMGDNHRYSKDSRHFGPIKKENIIGKVIKIKGK
ncbi:signal peptidase I [Neobacillus sp. NPDC093127]|uniref:signal peptidase I n=1 Tax=Neobacillus sp. NPDC093127 TaxID=3364296 RepID=UPI00380380C0